MINIISPNTIDVTAIITSSATSSSVAFVFVNLVLFLSMIFSCVNTVPFTIASNVPLNINESFKKLLMSADDKYASGLPPLSINIS